ncbi:cysteine-rich repeat secretory protein 41-like [Ziziphus jujuba]|uniref:Cysteine-rich repeat secretory protein 41-like n=1 Tax=Ziziphus jujuba TaxID=326968 RepID=A0ABM4A7T4_ZIZJJ|nr:cysteine-rich repeat secretory protein 41-like [Ziziphus jujuba]
MSYFSNEIHPNGWFSLGSKGHDMPKTHALALCGINVSAIDCKSSQNVSKPSLFDPKKTKLLRNVSHKTSHAQKMYGIGILQLNKSRELYGSAQCPRDLSSFDYRKCLFGTITVLERYAKGSRGARVYTESCSIRYELYNFFSQHELYNFIHKCNKEWGEIEEPHGTSLAQA